MLSTLMGRESGQSHRVSTDGLIHRLRRRHELEGHEGCVNSGTCLHYKAGLCKRDKVKFPVFWELKKTCVHCSVLHARWATPADRV